MITWLKTHAKSLSLPVLSGLLIASGVYATETYFDFDTGELVVSEAQRFVGALDITGDTTLTGDFTANTDQFFIDSTGGNIGIGTTSPNTTLDLSGALSTRGMSAPSVSPAGQGRIYFDSTSNTFKVSENGGSYVDLVGSGGATVAGSDGAVQFNSSGSLGADNANFFWDDTNNRLGIGTATPSTALNVAGAYYGSQLSAPGAPTVTAQGTTGTTTWGYKITATDGVGETLGSTEGTATDGNATLDATNFNRVTWSSVSGAVDYKIYRTTAGGTPSTTGLIGTVSASSTLQLDDTGLSASDAEPSGNTTGGAHLAGNVGVGTTGPAARLDINTLSTGETGLKISEPGSSGNKYIELQSDSIASGSYWIHATGNDASDAFVVRGDGNVGVGTASPSYKLHVTGSAAGFVGDGTGYLINVDDFTHGLAVGSDAELGTSGLDGVATIVRSGVGGSFAYVKDDTGTTSLPLSSPDILFRVQADNGEAYFSGNVGIGTQSPTEKLHVEVEDATNAGVTKVGNFYHLTSGTAGNGIGSQIQLTTENDAGNLRGGQMTYLLSDVTGGSETGRFDFGTHAGGGFGTRMSISGENVGIGTTAPSQQLTIENTEAGGGGIAQLKSSEGSMATNSQVGALEFYSSDNDDPGVNAYVKSLTGASYFGTGGQLVFATKTQQNRTPSNTLTERMRITDLGNVGIGTASPSAMLDVNGAAEINGNLTMSSGSDVEWGAYEIIEGQNTPSGLSVRAKTNPTSDNPIFAVESSGGATRFGVTQGNGGWFRDGLKVGYSYDAGGLPSNPNNLHVAGNVGIGTTSPSEKLHVNGNARIGNWTFEDVSATELAVNDSGGNSVIIFDESNPHIFWSQNLTPEFTTGTLTRTKSTDDRVYLDTDGSGDHYDTGDLLTKVREEPQQVDFERILTTVNLPEGASLTAEVRSSDDNFTTTKDSVTVDLEDGMETYGLEDLANAQYYRVLFEFEANGEGETPELIFFETASVVDENVESSLATSEDTDLSESTIDTATGTGLDSLSVGSGNTLQVTNDGTIVESGSSERFKRNITEPTIDTDLIYDLTPRSFVWNENTANAGQSDFGLIAEEVDKVLPELVHYNASGEPQGVRYSKLSVLMLNEMQEMNLKIDTLAAAQGAEFDGSMAGQFADGLGRLGFAIRDGVMHIREAIVGRLTVGSNENPTGITIFDEVTGEAQCVRSRNGEMVMTAGACDETSEEENTGESDDSEEDNTPDNESPDDGNDSQDDQEESSEEENESDNGNQDSDSEENEQDPEDSGDESGSDESDSDSEDSNEGGSEEDDNDTEDEEEGQDGQTDGDQDDEEGDAEDGDTEDSEDTSEKQKEEEGETNESDSEQTQDPEDADNDSEEEQTDTNSADE